MQKKRILSVILALCLILTLLPTFALADESTFSDMPSDYSTEALSAAVANGLLKGTDGKILPDDNLTRAQMAAIIVRAFGATETADLTGYTDVAAGAWYTAELGSAVYMKVLQGDGTTMRPDAPITRQEVFAVVARALKLSDGTAADLAAFSDAGSVASWAVGTTAAMVKAGYVHGSDGKLNPTANISRKDFAVIMDNVVKTYVKTAGVVTSVADGNVMVNVPGVTLKDLTVTGNLIVGDGVGDGDVTLENVKVTGSMIVRGGGVNYIIIKGDSSVGKVIITKVDGKVRVVAEDGTEIPVVIVEDGKDDVIVEGSIAKLEVAVSDVPVVVQNATISEVAVTAAKADVTVSSGSTVKTLTATGEAPKLTVAGKVETLTATESAAGAAIEVAKGGKVETVEVAAEGSAISGDGTVTNANVSGDNVTVSTPNTTVTAAEGTTGVKAGDKEVKGGESTKTEGGTTGGGSSVVPVSSVAIEGVAGTGAILTAKAAPSSATVTYQWKIADSKDGPYSDISGATGSTYSPSESDANRYLAVIITGTGAYSGTVTSDAVGPITSLPGEFNGSSVTRKRYQSGEEIVDGYVVDIRLEGATFESPSVTVTMLDEDGNLMQKNTLNSDKSYPNDTSLTASFDVNGTLTYGSWTVEGSVKGDFRTPGSVVIEVTLSNGKVLKETITTIKAPGWKVVNTRTGMTYTDPSALTTAIQAATAGDTLIIEAGTYELTSQLTLNKSLTLIGMGDVTLNAATDATWPTGNSTKHLLGVYSENVTVSIKNITFDSAGIAYGVQAYGGATLNLEDVTLKNSVGAGLTVNGSTVVADNLNTSGNTWGAVNVDPGSGVTTPSIFTLTGDGTLDEDTQIWSDGANVTGSATVTVTAEGYEQYAVGNDNNYPAYVWSTSKPEWIKRTSSDTTLYYESLQKAISAAVDGDTINLPAGTYTISATLTLREKSITLVGTGNDETIIQYNGTAQGGGMFAAPVNSGVSAKITFQDIGFKNVTSNVTKGNYVFLSMVATNENEVTFEDCAFDNFYTLAYFNNIRADQENNNKITIKDCVIENTSWVYSQDDVTTGSRPLQQSNVTLSGNTGDSAGNGPEVFTGVVVRDSTTLASKGKYSTGAAAVAAATSGDTLILTGTFDGFHVGKSVTIVGGTIKPVTFGGHSGRTGIWISGSITVIIEGVTVNGSLAETGTDTFIGIETTGKVDLTVRNSIINNITTGIYLNPTAKLTATGNTIDTVVAGIGTDQADLTGTISNNTITNFSSEAIGLNLPITSEGAHMIQSEANSLKATLASANDLDKNDVKLYGAIPETRT